MLKALSNVSKQCYDFSKVQSGSLSSDNQIALDTLLRSEIGKWVVRCCDRNYRTPLIANCILYFSESLIPPSGIQIGLKFMSFMRIVTWYLQLNCSKKSMFTDCQTDIRLIGPASDKLLPLVCSPFTKVTKKQLHYFPPQIYTYESKLFKLHRFRNSTKVYNYSDGG